MKSGKLKHGVMLLFDKTKFQLVEKEAKSYKNNTDVFASIYSQVYIFVTLKNIENNKEFHVFTTHLKAKVDLYKKMIL